jgi:TonB-linked SusC/RagA family outer membrane protein
MKYTCLIIALATIHVSASVYSQNTSFDLSVEGESMRDVFKKIEQTSEFRFFYNDEFKDLNKKVSLEIRNKKISYILDVLLKTSDVTYKILENNLIVITPTQATERTVTGTVTSEEDGTGLPGVNVILKGTAKGTVTDIDGKYSIEVPDESSILVFSSVGFIQEEVIVGSRSVIDLVLAPDIKALEEIVVVGFGTMKKRDLTGSVVRADMETLQEQPNVSIAEMLQGTIPGLNIGQIDQAGGEPEISIRGRTSLSGQGEPLIILDNAIYRGNIIDINPKDVESIDVLKDASAAAIYGSQASNGVILITTKKSGEAIDGKPHVNYSFSYAYQRPNKELRPDSPEDFMEKTEIADLFNSRTPSSGYLERNPTWDPTSNFKGPDELNAYQQGRSTDWYDLLTNDNIHFQNHNISLSNSTSYNNYFISLGYTEQIGYLLNEDYNRWNARINSDNTITDWLDIGVQSFFTLSDYSGEDADLDSRYTAPYQTAYDANGEYNIQPGGNSINPLIIVEGSDDLDKRMHLYGNLYANIKLPFVPGLSYRLNVANNYRTTSDYYFQAAGQNFLGAGYKMETKGHDINLDNILTYKKEFLEHHRVDVTLLYGFEKRNFNSTRAGAIDFVSKELGYNSLQVGNSEQQTAASNAWEEASLYSMARLFYSFKDKYMLTGTVRRDGFSGFGAENKFGVFPSVAAAWLVSNEPFFFEEVDLLKLRVSYGSNGNRTIGRYQTLAVVEGGFNYVNADGTPVYTQSISSLASPNLKWETTTGINVGVDFGFLNSRLQGSIDYYNNNTNNLLYEVDIPGISRFTTFPDNLGKIHNSGIEIALTSINIQQQDLVWSTSFAFSRNRNQLQELLGFDNDGDGKEDDLVSSGLFIDEPLDAIFTYEVDGIWGVGDEIPPGYDLGAFKVVDQTGDGIIDPNDRKIIGYAEPSYRFSINSGLRYKNWDLNIFLNSVQGGNNYYMASDDLLDWKIYGDNTFNFNFPEGLDYWAPENPDAAYQRPNIANISEGIQGTRYMQRNFVRLQNVSLAYTFPSDLLNKLHVQHFRLFVSGKNLATWTKWPGWDPETGIKVTPEGRPVMQSYNLGLEIGF